MMPEIMPLTIVNETDNPLSPPLLRGNIQSSTPTGQGEVRPETPVPALPPTEQLSLPVDTSPAGDDLYASLKKWQRDILSARTVILREIDAYRASTGRSLNKAINAFLTSVSSGGPEHLKRAAAVANNRKGSSRLLSRGTIYRWAQIREAEGIPGLVPADAETMRSEGIPLWLPAFLESYRRGSKPQITEALRQMGESAPAYHQVIRFLKKFSNLDLQRGRMTGSELRAIRAYTKRDFSDLLPMDIIVADGHSFKAYVSHPVHGKRFLPEVETIIDVASRAIVGWSAGLAESGQIVADAIRHAVTVSEQKTAGGLFAILYTDNGAGNRAKMNSDEVTGIVARIGGTIKFGIAGNPEGRGVIERLNKSLWIPAAKELDTYNGKDMDPLTQRRRLKIIDKDLKEIGSSKHLMSWPQFIEFIAQQVNRYNNSEHSSLPKIIDSNGHKRYATPLEQWQGFAADGWQPDTLNDEEMRDLFRPQVKCITRRGLVTVFTNEYFNAELEHHHGETVCINYDIHDPNVVWVRDQQQRLICEAVWNANRRDYFPKAVVEMAREKRAERRLALKREQIREIEEEARGVVEVEEHIPEECCMTIADCGLRTADSPEVFDSPPVLGGVAEGRGGIPIDQTTTPAPPYQGGEPPDTDDRPFFSDEIARYEWHLKNGFHSDEDLKFKLDFEQSDSYRMLREMWQ